jgi:O-acetyl-ADP-ribose deacetylase (regulator of RNase III)
MTLSYYFSLQKANSKFLVTEIGCGIAGFTVEQIAPLFNKAIDEKIKNIFSPASFYKILTKEKTPNR